MDIDNKCAPSLPPELYNASAIVTIEAQGLGVRGHKFSFEFSGPSWQGRQQLARMAPLSGDFDTANVKVRLLNLHECAPSVVFEASLKEAVQAGLFRNSRGRSYFRPQKVTEGFKIFHC